MGCGVLKGTLGVRWSLGRAAPVRSNFLAPAVVTYFGLTRSQPLYTTGPAASLVPVLTDDLASQWEAALGSGLRPFIWLKFIGAFLGLSFLSAWLFSLAAALLSFVCVSFSGSLSLVWLLGGLWAFLGVWVLISERFLGGKFLFLGFLWGLSCCFYFVWGALGNPLARRLILRSSPEGAVSSLAEVRGASLVLGAFRGLNSTVFLGAASSFPQAGVGFAPSGLTVWPQVYASWSLLQVTQVASPSNLVFKGLAGGLLAPQFLAQGVHASSWLFLRAAHNTNAVLPAAPAAQAGGFWGFHRAVRLVCGVEALALFSSARPACVKGGVLRGDLFPLPPAAGFSTSLPPLKGLLWQGASSLGSSNCPAWLWVPSLRSRALPCCGDLLAEALAL